MRNPIYNDDFEHYLQKQAGQHRMYPSDHIWRNIQQEIHGYRRWPALTFTAVTVISLLVAGTFLMKPDKKILSIEEYKRTHITAALPPSKSEQTYESIDERVSPDKLTERTLAAVKVKLDRDAQKSSPTNIAYQKPKVDDANLHAVTLSNSKVNAGVNNIAKIETFNAAPSAVIEEKLISKPSDFSVLRSSYPKEDKSLEINLNLPAVTPSSEYVNNLLGSIKIKKQKLNAHRFSYQFYITPSSSYRKLVDDKDARVNSSYIPANASINYADANQVVRHKPAMGMEVGFGIGYSLSNRFTLKTGLQFNIRQYNIEAYRSNYETASIGLDGAAAYNTVSSYRSSTGNNPITLRNKYFELAVPIGIDFKIIDGGRISWNVAAALQPTYTFDKEPFLLSSDLKSYANGSELMRNWNLNSNLETYISIQAGDYRWQIGPQFRYQSLPTYISKYPIKEHLFDYGLKIGFFKRIN